jgi:dTDP-glucose pyrophosphorylase
MTTASAEDEPLLGIILAAGKGTRLSPFSERHPKPLLPILGRPLIEHHIQMLKDVGVRRVLVVIGHLGAEIVRVLGDGARLGVSVEYVEQGPTLGIAHALSRTEPYVDRPFLLFLGDVYLVHRGLNAMVAMLGRDDVQGVLGVKEESSAEAIRRNFVAMENVEGFVERVVEKPRHPRTRLKGCGVYLFDPDFFDAVRRTPRTALRDEYEITDAIQIFVDDGYRVKAARVIEDDVNISYPADLLDLNLRLLGERSVVGAGTRIHPQARIERSLVLEGAEVAHPVLVRESILFPGASLRKDSDVIRQIVTAEHVIDCM